MKQTVKDIRDMLTGLYDLPEIDSFIFLIINHLTGLSKSQVFVNPGLSLSASDVEEIRKITLRLTHFEPIQYILGKTEFYGFPFFVEPGVLIPRFETEELVDCIVKENSGNDGLKIIDIGCGSGCIAVSIKKNLPDAVMWACDISDIALEITARNALLNKTDIHIEKFDILADTPFVTSDFNIIVSNPPYVTCREKETMPRNVLDYEPEVAFVPDEDPLLFYRAIVSKSRDLLLPGGKIYFEINEAFGSEIVQLLVDNGFRSEIIKDINGKDRIAKGYKNK